MTANNNTELSDERCYTLPNGDCIGACALHNGVDANSGEFLPVYNTKYQMHVPHPYSHPLLFARMDPNLPMLPPTRAHDGDCGYDLYVDRDYTVAPMTHTLIGHNIRVQLPPNIWGLLVGRSSNWKRMLEVGSAVIDNGYRGSLYARVLNLAEEDINLHEGDRIAQLILIPMFTPPALYMKDLTDTDRGRAGFGSTGR